MNNKTIVLVIVVALIFFALGLFSANLLNQGVKIGQIPTGEKIQNTFQAGWEAAKQRLKDSGFVPMMENMEIKMVYGEIKDIKDNQILLKIRPLEPLADPELDDRIIQIQSDTKIYQLVQKNPVEYQKEIEEYNKKINEQMKNPTNMGSTSLVMPEPFIKKSASLSDIKVGQQISVFATNDIKTVKQFTAVEISMQVNPAMISSSPATATTSPTSNPATTR